MASPSDAAGSRADSRFDDALRAAHAAAVANVSHRTRAELGRLHAALSASAPAATHRPAWGLALACSLALVAVIGLRVRAPDAIPSAPVIATTGDRVVDSGDLVASLDETPDLYLWLASSDASGFVPENP